MKKKNLVIASVLAVVLVGTLAFAQTGMLEGRFRLFSKFDPAKIFLYRSRYVSAVASPVTSVVVSEVPSEVVSEVPSKVTSKGGTSVVVSKVPSEVTSEVPSTVTTAVASAVAVSDAWAQEAKKYSIKQLTKSVLEKAAKEDYKANPSKYKLTSRQIQQVLDMYEQKNK